MAPSYAVKLNKPVIKGNGPPVYEIAGKIIVAYQHLKFKNGFKVYSMFMKIHLIPKITCGILKKSIVIFLSGF